MQEREIIKRILRGEQEAFELLIAPHGVKILSHLKQMVKDDEVALDLLQDASIHAFQKLGSFKQKSTFYTWYWRIAHNLALNWLKKQKRASLVELKSEQMATQEPSFLQEVQDNEVVLEKMALLSEKQRLVFELYVVEKLSQKEIAGRLKVPVGTVRSRLFYARKKMGLSRGLA